MAGGGSQLMGIDKIVNQATKTQVTIANDPLTCVVRGCGKLLEDKHLLSKIRVTKML